jgi:hypothetical protein
LISAQALPYCLMSNRLLTTDHLTSRLGKAPAVVVLCGVLYFAGATDSRSPAQSPARAQSKASQTESASARALAQWRSGLYPGNRYMGSLACAQCHAYQADAQAATPMARAIESGSDSRILSAHAPLDFRNGPYNYQITYRGGQADYSVSDGAKAISEPILYSFGEGVAGQTYVFRHNGNYYESRVSFYQATQNLDITILHSHSVPGSLEAALGRPLSQEAAYGCFACHSTPAAGQQRFDLSHLAPGVGCERCHGPGENHIAAIKAGDLENPQIFNPGKLDAIDQMQEFCGQCHESFDQVTQLSDQGGLNNIRFQPYRMFKSPGHLTDDRRIACTACHDPHGKSSSDAAFYDAKCLACHVSSSAEAKTAARGAPACPVSKQQCVTCHMPKIELPEMHYRFTDHWIRIVKPGDPIPK